MSATLLMYLLDAQYLAALERDDNVVPEHAQRVGHGYGWSGSCMTYTLMYLEEQGIAFDNVGEYTVLVPADRDLLDLIDPANHDAAELDAFLMEELGGEQDQGWAGQAGLDSLRVLHDHLERLGDGDVLLVQVA